MRKIAYHSFTMGRRAIGYGLFGILITLLTVGIITLNKRPDLQIWQTVDLDEEFTEKSNVTDFSGYLKLEDRLFKQLESEVYQKTGRAAPGSINRYQHGSRLDPTAMTPNWNRTFQLTNDHPAAAVLMLHGMSDSPYSMRHLAEGFHAAGATVIGLRIPGHGTAPSGLVEVKWQDMAAAVRLAARHLRATIGDKPLFLVGYSNGGALSVHYALESLSDESLPRPSGLVLLSPEIGISPAAALAVWQGRIGHWLGLDKLAWNSISLEYDPYKYGSFAVNAGDQAYRITKAIDQDLARMEKLGKLSAFPPVIAFQSAIDATVSAPDLVTRLFNRLPPSGHELVIFDVNRRANILHLLDKDPRGDLDRLLANPSHPFALTVVTNQSSADRISSQVFANRRPNGSPLAPSEIGLSWPNDVYSLSHIALPFPDSDPFYGTGQDGITTLGNLTLRGERGVLRISPSEMLRQRWNPFFPWLQARALDFCSLRPPSPSILTDPP